MSMEQRLSVGQEGEARSFSEGYRGAWFRCKIRGISLREENLGFSLEYFDYPDEEFEWVKLLQKPPLKTNQSHDSQDEIMVRPAFPPIFRESQLPRPDLFRNSDVVVVINDNWKIGDLVDWWCDDCYWSGRITKLHGKDKVWIKLPEAPIGEGKSYIALCDDLRPSLDWTTKHGWTVPKEGASMSCARLLRPKKKRKSSCFDSQKERIGFSALYSKNIIFISTYEEKVAITKKICWLITGAQTWVLPLDSQAGRPIVSNYVKNNHIYRE